MEGDSGRFELTGCVHRRSRYSHAIARVLQRADQVHPKVEDGRYVVAHEHEQRRRVKGFTQSAVSCGGLPAGTSRVGSKRATSTRMVGTVIVRIRSFMPWPYWRAGSGQRSAQRSTNSLKKLRQSSAAHTRQLAIEQRNRRAQTRKMMAPAITCSASGSTEIECSRNILASNQVMRALSGRASKYDTAGQAIFTWRAARNLDHSSVE